MEALNVYKDQSVEEEKSTAFYDLLKFYADNQYLNGSIKDLDDYNAINKYYSFHCMKIPTNLLSESNFYQYIQQYPISFNIVLYYNYYCYCISRYQEESWKNK